MHRLDRVNSFLQTFTIALAILALCLYVVVETQVNFDGVNSSSFITAQMPWMYH